MTRDANMMLGLKGARIMRKERCLESGAAIWSENRAEFAGPN